MLQQGEIAAIVYYHDITQKMTGQYSHGEVE